MVRALSAVIVMAVSVSGSYLADALVFLGAHRALVAGTAGLNEFGRDYQREARSLRLDRPAGAASVP
jgi:hypothetical protein